MENIYLRLRTLVQGNMTWSLVTRPSRSIIINSLGLSLSLSSSSHLFHIYYSEIKVKKKRKKPKPTKTHTQRSIYFFVVRVRTSLLYDDWPSVDRGKISYHPIQFIRVFVTLQYRTIRDFTLAMGRKLQFDKFNDLVCPGIIYYFHVVPGNFISPARRCITLSLFFSCRYPSPASSIDENFKEFLIVDYIPAEDVNDDHSIARHH